MATSKAHKITPPARTLPLQAAINRYLAEHNADPKPFVRTATSASIIAKLGRVNVSVS